MQNFLIKMGFCQEGISQNRPVFALIEILANSIAISTEEHQEIVKL